jgi:hypothetical protein
MTFTQEEEPADHIRFIDEYEDGSKHFFAVPQCTLEQGLSNERRYSITSILAYEWQQEGYLKPGKIARVYRDPQQPLALDPNHLRILLRLLLDYDSAGRCGDGRVSTRRRSIGH